ncbi:hypothetical protein LRY60_01280 [Candidatus Woesebacteria bacterium]|nr:hypothetical protein [Candidatus Woesebacteria bacterium]
MQEEIKTPQAGIDDAQVHAEIIRIEAISESKKGFVLSLIDILKTTLQKR